MSVKIGPWKTQQPRVKYQSRNTNTMMITSWMIEEEHQKRYDQKLKVLEQKHGEQNDRDTLK